MTMGKLDDTFISYASSVLTKNNQGMSREDIIEHCNAYALNFNVTIPITSPDVGDFASAVLNRYTALYKNLTAFNGQQQFDIIRDLCDLPQFEKDDKVQGVKKKMFKQYARFALAPLFLEKFPPTDWERVDQALDDMIMQVDSATTAEAFMAIGALGRDVLTIIARHVFDADKHPTLDGIKVGPELVVEPEAVVADEAAATEGEGVEELEITENLAAVEAVEKHPVLVDEAGALEANRMLEAYLKAELTDGAEMAMDFVNKAVDLAHKLTQHQNATRREASICLIATTAVASLIKTIEETAKQPEPELVVEEAPAPETKTKTK